ncbi:Crp/Fnr family transcriptional regulator [Spirosoma terrae]|uniref:Crp/Fnr family transcriptional regulator n=1 Tax=Spirosoma terrae TaxID=1968276 RepID=A0A6L9LAE6_9BACT|nr:Crp/Fnr family transcriptional regulator [Spirosoma terrae]NDU97504.1 Crp/Fnr family transcriptional regulator [Spirosoma terrae]
MRDALKEITQLDDNTWQVFNNVITETSLQKGDLLVYPGQVCRHIYFLETGLLRSFLHQEGEERNVAFTSENAFVTDLKSLRSGQPTELTIQALEQSTVLQLAKTDLMRLYHESHQIETFGRQLLEALLEAREEYATWFTLHSAKERYELFSQKYPSLLQRLALGHIASFLGIRRETLSRIRHLK